MSLHELLPTRAVCRATCCLLPAACCLHAPFPAQQCWPKPGLSAHPSQSSLLHTPITQEGYTIPSAGPADLDPAKASAAQTLMRALVSALRSGQDSVKPWRERLVRALEALGAQQQAEAALKAAERADAV